MKEVNEQEMLRRMAAYCSSAERCVQEVRKKLEVTTLQPEEADRIVARLLHEGFLDEQRFARAFVNDKFRFNHWGKVKIGYELRKKAIPPAYIEDALESLSEESYMSDLAALLKTKLKTLKAKDDRERYYKLLRFAAGRGFSVQEANVCIRKLLNNTEDYETTME